METFENLFFTLPTIVNVHEIREFGSVLSFSTATLMGNVWKIFKPSYKADLQMQLSEYQHGRNEEKTNF